MWENETSLDSRMPKLNIEGTDYYYLTNRCFGEARGQRVVYVHGTGCNSHVFERHINALSDHQAIAIAQQKLPRQTYLPMVEKYVSSLCQLF